jgi:deoxyribodipyrimidine photo-lyase
MTTCLHIFRRDLRLNDNTALNKASQEHDIIPAFIFDPRQVETNEYKSDNAVQFMIESLHELSDCVEHDGGQLHVFWGEPTEIINDVADTIDAVSFNNDYTPFSKERDQAMRDVCDDNGLDVITADDAYLTTPGSVTTNKGTTYKVFTYFEKSAKRRGVNRPQTNEHTYDEASSALRRELNSVEDDVIDEHNESLAVNGGRSNAERRLDHAASLGDYDETREHPWEDGTTRLSAYLKFGVVSPREAYWAVRDSHGEDHGVISELYWRDFYAHLLDAYPELLHENLKDKYDDVAWRDDPDGVKRWKNGRTGFPIVDAAMRQLTETGWMHNRCRMITAAFLCKDLRVHWKTGERFFAQHLVDYDPASNNGGWQWAASTGADSQPYFRMFNPWRQQEKYDADCEYIKRFVPELRGLDPETIHGLEDNDVPGGVDYPEPIVDHSEAATKTKEVFKEASQ